MNVASMTRAIIAMEMGMGMGTGTGMTRIIIQMAASWGLGRMGYGSVGRILSRRDGSDSSQLIIFVGISFLLSILFVFLFLLRHLSRKEDFLFVASLATYVTKIF